MSSPYTCDLPNLHILSLLGQIHPYVSTKGEWHDQIPTMVFRPVSGRISTAWYPVFTSSHSG